MPFTYDEKIHGPTQTNKTLQKNKTLQVTKLNKASAIQMPNTYCTIILLRKNFSSVRISRVYLYTKRRTISRTKPSAWKWYLRKLCRGIVYKVLSFSPSSENAVLNRFTFQIHNVLEHPPSISKPFVQLNAAAEMAQLQQTIRQHLTFCVDIRHEIILSVDADDQLRMIPKKIQLKSIILQIDKISSALYIQHSIQTPGFVAAGGGG